MYEVGTLAFGVVIPCAIAALCGRRIRAYLSVGFVISLALGVIAAAIAHGMDDDDTVGGSVALGMVIFGSMLVVYLAWSGVFLGARWIIGRGSRWRDGG